MFLLRMSVPTSPESHTVVSAEGLRVKEGCGETHAVGLRSCLSNMGWQLQVELFNSNKIICLISQENDAYCTLTLSYSGCSCSHGWFFEVWSQSELRKALQSF